MNADDRNSENGRKLLICKNIRFEVNKKIVNYLNKSTKGNS